MLSKKRLHEIRARAEAATEGPWEWQDVQSSSQNEKYFRDWRLSSVPRDRVFLADAGTLADADFVVHARQDIPDLLDEIDRLRKIEITARKLLNDSGDLAKITYPDLLTAVEGTKVEGVMADENDFSRQTTVDTKERLKSTGTILLTEVVMPALNEIKADLEKKGETVRVSRDADLLGFLRITGMSNPSRTEVTYIVNVDDRDYMTLWCELIFRPVGKEREAIKVGFDPTEVAQSDIKDAFTRLFDEMTQ